MLKPTKRSKPWFDGWYSGAPDEAVEAVVRRVVLRRTREIAQVPLADGHGAVAAPLQRLGQSDLGGRQAGYGVPAPGQVDGAELGEHHSRAVHRPTQKRVVVRLERRHDAAA